MNTHKKIVKNYLHSVFHRDYLLLTLAGLLSVFGIQLSANTLTQTHYKQRLMVQVVPAKEASSSSVVAFSQVLQPPTPSSVEVLPSLSLDAEQSSSASSGDRTRKEVYTASSVSSAAIAVNISEQVQERLQNRLLQSASSAVAVDTLHGAAKEPEHNTIAVSDFPAFSYAQYPVARTPNWGAMSTPAVWNRTFAEMSTEDFVSIPAYSKATLTTPIAELLTNRWDNIAAITAKLFYSTRYFGAYNIDAWEFSANHPGIDLKVAEGTPVLSVAGGRVVSTQDRGYLGNTIVIEHRHEQDGTFYSVYGHLALYSVSPGDTVAPGTVIGTVGMTGNTSGPHIHLQIDRGEAGVNHVPYAPAHMPSPVVAEQNGINPILFIDRY